MFFITLPSQRNKAGVVAVCVLQYWPGDAGERRRLIEVTIESTQHPVELGDKHRSANPRIYGVFNHACFHVRLPQATDERDPVSWLVAILDKDFFHTRRDFLWLRKIWTAAIVEDHAKNIMFVLGITVEAAAQRILRDHRRKRGLHSGIISGLIGTGGVGQILQAGIIFRAVVMVEGRKLEQGGSVEVVNPGKGNVAVRLVLPIPQTTRIVELVLPRVNVGVVGDLVVVRS